MDERVQGAAPDLIGEIQDELGGRYGGAWIVPADEGDIVHIGVTDGGNSTGERVLAAARRHGIADRVVIDVVRYSREELERFSEELGVLSLARFGSLIGWGPRDDLNAVQLLVSADAPDLVAKVASVVPHDALVVKTIPGGKIRAF